MFKYFEEGRKMIDELTKSLIQTSRDIMEGKKLDPVGREDGDVDNDGDQDDTDKYLIKRREDYR